MQVNHRLCLLDVTSTRGASGVFYQQGKRTHGVGLNEQLKRMAETNADAQEAILVLQGAEICYGKREPILVRLRGALYLTHTRP